METPLIAEIIVALLAMIGTVSGNVLASRKTTALISYRIDKLEEKVNKHNNLIERMYECEKKIEVLSEKQSVANHRIDDLEGEVHEHE